MRDDGFSMRNSRRFALGMAFLLGVVGVVAQQPASGPSAASRPAVDPRRWEADIREFEKWDRKNAPPRDALLFVGSSSIVGWATATAFPEWPVINRGFGGAHISDVSHHVERVVTPYRPRAIVLYAGDNDVAAGLSAEQVASDFVAFVECVRRRFQETPIVFLSIKPSRARWEHWPTMRDANRRISVYCKKQPNLRFVDVGTCLLNESGEPRADFFVADQLHLNPKGYAAWEQVLRPKLAALMNGESAPNPDNK